MGLAWHVGDEDSDASQSPRAECPARRSRLLRVAALVALLGALALGTLWVRARQKRLAIEDEVRHAVLWQHEALAAGDAERYAALIGAPLNAALRREVRALARSPLPGVTLDPVPEKIEVRLSLPARGAEVRDAEAVYRVTGSDGLSSGTLDIRTPLRRSSDGRWRPLRPEDVLPSTDPADPGAAPPVLSWANEEDEGAHVRQGGLTVAYRPADEAWALGVVAAVAPYVDAYCAAAAATPVVARGTGDQPRPCASLRLVASGDTVAVRPQARSLVLQVPRRVALVRPANSGGEQLIGRALGRLAVMAVAGWPGFERPAIGRLDDPLAPALAGSLGPGESVRGALLARWLAGAGLRARPEAPPTPFDPNDSEVKSGRITMATMLAPAWPGGGWSTAQAEAAADHLASYLVDTVGLANVPRLLRGWPPDDNPDALALLAPIVGDSALDVIGGWPAPVGPFPGASPALLICSAAPHVLMARPRDRVPRPMRLCGEGDALWAAPAGPEGALAALCRTGPTSADSPHVTLRVGFEDGDYVESEVYYQEGNFICCPSLSADGQWVALPGVDTSDDQLPTRLRRVPDAAVHRAPATDRAAALPTGAVAAGGRLIGGLEDAGRAPLSGAKPDDDGILDGGGWLFQPDYEWLPGIGAGRALDANAFSSGVVWAPRGELFMFRAAADEIAVMSPSGEVRWRTPGEAARWAPDGDRLVVQEEVPGGLRLTVLEARTGTELARDVVQASGILTPSTAGESGAHLDAGLVGYSADGHWVALCGAASLLEDWSGTTGFCRAWSPGDGRTALTRLAVAPADPTWLPYGAKLVYAISMDFGGYLYSFSPDTGSEASAAASWTDDNFPTAAPVADPPGRYAFVPSGAALDLRSTTDWELAWRWNADCWAAGWLPAQGMP